MSLFNELKRRNVFKVGVAYLVLAWIVVQVTDTAVPALRLPEWVNSLVFLFGLIGFPFAIFFAWAFEMTPEGVKKESEVERDESISQTTGKKLEYTIIGLLILALGYFFWSSTNQGTPQLVEQAALKSEATQEINSDDINSATDNINPASIAVLAFTDMSQDKNQEYFSDGITEEILNVLVKINSLSVSSRTSSFQFKGQELGIPEIARQLKVRHIVEGSVRKSGGTIRITAQLIDAENDKHLWSESYDRPLNVENIFAIQDEIAQSIVAALSQTLGVVKAADTLVIPTTDNLSAYDLFLKARPLFQARVDLDKADELLVQALKLDPQYAQAWEMHAALQTLMYEYGYSGQISRNEAEKRGIDYAERALAINTNSATALAVLAKTRSNRLEELREKVDITELFADFNRALSLEPRNASTLNWRGLLHLTVGNLELAYRDFASCISYEPYYEPCLENHMVMIGILKNDQEGLDAYLKLLNLGVMKIEYADTWLLARMDQELAFKSVTNSTRSLHGFRRQDDLFQAMKNPQGDHSELVADINEFWQAQPDRDAAALVWITMGLGDFDVLPNTGSQWLKSAKAYRQSSQFQAYIIKAGIFNYWKKQGFPPQCRPLGDDGFECD